jgi:dolichol-phosphate mannosyltransferase
VLAAAKPDHALRRAALPLAALIDIFVFWALLRAGKSLGISHLAAFAAGVAAIWLLQFRARSLAGRRRDARTGPRIAVVTLMALFLRGGVLGLLTLRCHWLPQIAILFAIAAGYTVMLPGYSYAVADEEPLARWRLFAFGLIAYAVALRFIYAGAVELMPEEAYYWNYSRHLDYGYLDHPPMVAWLIRLGTSLLGQTELGVRAGALLCGAVTSVFIFKLARNAFGETSALAALLLAQSLPFFFLAGLIMTPDAPLSAAWAASLYFLERALIGKQPGAWWRAGVCLGIGMISKYTIALLVPVTLLFVLWDSDSRRWLRRPQPYVAALLALGVFSPVIIWNSQHHWVSFAFQTSRRLAEAPQFALHKLIASLLVLMTPTGVAAFILALLAVGRRVPPFNPELRRPFRLLALGVLMPLAVFVIFSLRHEVKLDWTGASWTAALPIMGFAMAVPRLRAAWSATVVVMLLIYGAGLYYLVLGLPGVGYSKHTELLPIGWRELGATMTDAAAAAKRETGSDVLVVGLDRYAIASEMAFYGAEHLGFAVKTANSHLFEGMGLMYGQWVPPESQEHRDLLLIAWDPNELAGRYIESHVESLGPIKDAELTRDGGLVRRYYYRLAYNYRSLADSDSIGLK